MSKKGEFGERVLAIMEADRDWGADTMDQIGSAAIELGLAELDEDTMFVRVAQPATPPATTPWPPHIMKAVRTEYFPASYSIKARDGDGNWIRYKRTDAKIECDHYAAAVALITKHWTNSPEVLDPARYTINGGWMEPAVYVWVVTEVQR